MEKNDSESIKKYSKPIITVVELLPEERIAGTGCVRVSSHENGECDPPTSTLYER